MIVRGWKARATAANAPAYRALLEKDVFPKLRSIDGFAGADLLERRDDDGVEIVVMSRWASMEAVRGFAGAAPDRAVVEPDARAVLTSFDETVAHYDIAAEAAP